MNLSDYLGLGTSAPDTPAETLKKAVWSNQSEAALKMLNEAQTPCARLDLAAAAQGGDNASRESLMGIAQHLDGTETISMWRTEFHMGGTLVASVDQQICKR